MHNKKSKNHEKYIELTIKISCNIIMTSKRGKKIRTAGDFQSVLHNINDQL